MASVHGGNEHARDGRNGRRRSPSRLSVLASALAHIKNLRQQIHMVASTPNSSDGESTFRISQIRRDSYHVHGHQNQTLYIAYRKRWGVRSCLIESGTRLVQKFYPRTDKNSLWYRKLHRLCNYGHGCYSISTI